LKHIIAVNSFEQLSYLSQNAECVIYSPFEYIKADIESFAKRCKLPVYLNLPNIARGEDVDLLRSINIDNYVINNPYGFESAKGKNIILGMGLNIVNSQHNGLKILGLESKTFFNDTDIVYAFGRPVVMTFCHKPPPVVTDDHGAKFKILRTKLVHNYYNMYNNLPINVLPLLKQKKTLGKVGLLYDFASYDVSELKKFKYEDLLDPKYPSTRGHLYRGVE